MKEQWRDNYEMVTLSSNYVVSHMFKSNKGFPYIFIFDL